MVQKIGVDSDHAEQNCVNAGMRKGRGTAVKINKATIKYEQRKRFAGMARGRGRGKSENSATRKSENKGNRKQGEYMSSR